MINIYIYNLIHSAFLFQMSRDSHRFCCFCLHQKRLDIGLHFGSGSSLYTAEMRLQQVFVWAAAVQQLAHLWVAGDRASSDEMLCGECSLWRMDLGFNMTKGRPISCLGLCLGLMKHQQLLSEVTCGEVIEFPPKNVETNGNMWSSTKHKSAEQDLCL